MTRASTPTLLLAGFLLALVAPVSAQTHRIAAPQKVVRAIGVYEWTGDLAKPAASRLIPVSLFIDGHFEDAGVYLARPVPLALETGNVYSLDQAGISHGTLDVLAAGRLSTTGDLYATYGDAWVGNGTFIPPTVAKVTPLKRSKTLSALHSSNDPDRPTLINRSPDDNSTANSTPGDKSSNTTNASSKPDAPNPAPADDPDRPTLRRRSPAERKAAQKQADQASVSGPSGSLNDDPNRPTLHRGRPAGSVTSDDLAKLTGLPPDLHQLVAVSDPADRPSHPFDRPWDDENEHTAILAQLQTMARAQLTAYEKASPPSVVNQPAAATKSAQAPAPKSQHPLTAAQRAAQRRKAAAAAKAVPPPEPLLDEQLHAYTLSYGGAPTFVYTAHTTGAGVTLRYVTLVAQRSETASDDADGHKLLLALHSVTDAAHLDATPEFRLVDAVDAEASNRASLLFELRYPSSRQFALYRVLSGRSEQIFLSGTTQ